MSVGVIASHYVDSAGPSGPDYDSLVLAKSPAFYWKMDEASFTNGQNLVDSSGNSRSLTLHGSGLSVGSSLLASGVGGSLIMSGAGGTYGDLASGLWSQSWLNTTSFTICYLTNMRSGDSWQLQRWGVSSGQRDWVSIISGWVSAWVGGAQKDVTYTVPPLGKHHFAHRVSYNGSTTTQTVFIDGVQAGTRTDSGSINLNATNVLVGGDTTSTPVPQPCQLSRMAYFSTALADSDISGFAAAWAGTPTIVASSINSGSAAVSITLPSGIVAGDTLLIFVGSNYSTNSTPAGWNRSATNVANHNGAVLWRTADGTESSTTISIGTGGNDSWNAVAHVVRGGIGVRNAYIGAGMSNASSPYDFAYPSMSGNSGDLLIAYESVRPGWGGNLSGWSGPAITLKTTSWTGQTGTLTLSSTGTIPALSMISTAQTIDGLAAVVIRNS